MGTDLKYGRITTEHGDIHEDEPVFLLRARDVLAIETLTHYNEQCDRFGCASQFRGDVNCAIDRFTEFKGPKKLPD